MCSLYYKGGCFEIVMPAGVADVHGDRSAGVDGWLDRVCRGGLVHGN